MKKSLLVAILSFLSLTALPQEQDQSSVAEMNAQMQQMQARMQAMRAQMARIHATEDPQARRSLMQEHMQSMHEGMMMMGEMMGSAMPEGQMQQCQQGDTECRMNRMELQQRMMGQRMGMMQQMMQLMTEQMMEQQAPTGEESEDHEEHH